MMYERQTAEALNVCLQEFPAVAFLGPRQEGKATLAHPLMGHTYQNASGQMTRPALRAPTPKPNSGSNPVRHWIEVRDEALQ